LIQLFYFVSLYFALLSFGRNTGHLSVPANIFWIGHSIFMTG